MEWQLQVESVEQVKEHVVLDPMMGVHQRLLFAQNGDTVCVIHISLETLNVGLVLTIMEVEKQQLEVEEEQQEEVKQL